MVRKTEEVAKPKRAPRKTTKRQPKNTEITASQTEENRELDVNETSPIDALIEKTIDANQDLISTEHNIPSIDQAVGSNLPIAKADAEIEQKLIKPPAGSLGSDLRIFQIHYESWQRELLDPNFIALDNAKSTSELLEFDVFLRLFKSDYVKDARLWGALSWRFAEKTGMSGRDLIKTIQDNPGYDVYFCNPIPENEALYHNMWLQGEISHPQFLGLLQAIFKVTGLPLDALVGIESIEKCSVANYFVGTPVFWQTYLTWVQSFLNLANKNLPPDIRDLMHSSVADDRGLHGGATYVPFIVERLFPLFMKIHAEKLKGFKIALPERERDLNVHVRLLREMKEMSHRTKSAWLAACWVNYRNLYLMQIKGKDWCQNNLSNITPKEIKFN